MLVVARFKGTRAVRGSSTKPKIPKAQALNSELRSLNRKAEYHTGFRNFGAWDILDVVVEHWALALACRRETPPQKGTPNAHKSGLQQRGMLERSERAICHCSPLLQAAIEALQLIVSGSTADLREG